MNDKPLVSQRQLRKPVGELTMNEMCFDEFMFYDQKCYWGCRYGSYAVYCHHSDGPMKCRGSVPDGDCENFKENEPVKEIEE